MWCQQHAFFRQEEPSWFSLDVKFLFHYSLICGFDCSTAQGLLCHIFHFVMSQMFSVCDSPGRAVEIHTECGLGLSCWNKEGLSIQSLCISFSFNGVFTDVQVTQAKSTNSTLYHHRLAGWPVANYLWDDTLGIFLTFLKHVSGIIFQINIYSQFLICCVFFPFNRSLLLVSPFFQPLC